jgi:hypothetical protein
VSDDFEGTAKAWWDQQPHPRAPSLRISEFATAVKLATMAKFGGHATPHEASLFWPEFQASGLSPEEFEQTLERIAPLSYTFHGRPPTMKEIATLKDKQPHEARKYFSDLPDPRHPELTAGDMVKSYQSAAPHAREQLGRDPALTEAAYLHHSGESPRDYYANLAAQEQPTSDTLGADAVQPQVGGDARGRSVGAPGGPPPRE